MNYEIPKKRYYTPVIRDVAKSQMVFSFPSDLQNYFMESTYESLYLMVKVHCNPVQGQYRARTGFSL